MNIASVEREFFLWIETLERSQLSVIDCKLINLLIVNFDTIFPLGTAKGNRAKKIGELITKNHGVLPSELPDLEILNSGDTKKIDHIAELKIGPFRGFATSESFAFEKKYTFMYGPNGSGKSSFCEGLEFALLGSIEEAESKRIPLSDYIQNMQSAHSEIPKAYAMEADMRSVEVPQNPAAYRFAFIEKNRIDGFARITAATQGTQKDRIATLFGLDAFSNFVDGFTDDFDDRYITLDNQKENDFRTEYQKNETSKDRITKIRSDLAVNTITAKELIREVANESVVTLEDLKRFLVGEDNLSGIINDLQHKRTAQIPDDLKTDIIDNFPQSLMVIHESLKKLNINLDKLIVLSSDINYKDLYNAIVKISEDPGADRTVCPACKTPIKHAAVNPFINAISEIKKLQSLADLQKQINDLGQSLSKKVRSVITNISSINALGENVGYKGPTIPVLSEFSYTDIVTIAAWKPQFETELADIEKLIQNLDDLRISVVSYNSSLQAKRMAKSAVDEELKKHQNYKSRYDGIIAKQKTLEEEKEKLQKDVEEFQNAHETKLKEIEEEATKIRINRQYVESYYRLIGNLKLYRDQLPSKLAAGLSEKVRDYYNTVNSHDPDFERLETLSLPTAPGQNITIRFQNDSREYNALMILSDGHIKVCGLSILLAKAVKENLGFLIFDDIVNAIDDDHRDGIAELLLKHPDLKDRQQIVTCHGEVFINKLEHKLGAALASKEVKSYRFLPADQEGERCVRISVGDSKHYLLKAKEFFERNELKDSVSRCRLAVESISQQLWKKLDKVFKIELTVKMRSPGSNPDLSTVVDSLIKEIKNKPGLECLHEKLKLLKEKYSWCLLNKGPHEQNDLPEFERADVKDLLVLISEIENIV